MALSVAGRGSIQWEIHWVNTWLNQLVLQFEPSRRCILKGDFRFLFLLQIGNIDLHFFFFFYQTWSGGANKGILKNLSENLIGKTHVVGNAIYYIFQDLILYCTKKVPRNPNQFCHFCHGGGTHFLVLAPTLILVKFGCMLQLWADMTNKKLRVACCFLVILLSWKL